MTTLWELTSLVDGELVGDPDLEITGVSEVQNGVPGTITFVHIPKYRQYLQATEASAVLTGKDELLENFNGIRSENPTVALSKILDHFAPEPGDNFGIHETAVVHSSVTLGKEVTVGPFAVIEEKVSIGDGVKIGPQCTISKNSSIGSGSKLKSLVAIYSYCNIGSDVLIHSGTVIGCDGYGFATEGRIHLKIPQIGGVEIGDNVEIGANCAIDRGTIGNTVIGQGSKLDNLVHIAHNVKIGKGCLLTAQAAVAGSSVIGDYVAFGGKASVAGHLEVGDHAKLAAKSGVTKSLSGGETYAGMPAREISEKNRQDAHISRMPMMAKKLKELEKRLAELEKNG
ncbi:MAG: UDP-3-O-(3-hydroxymyristoyl)glucosamine N-acyltransferase [Candidatus Neomarinimicrobiota bacterium]|nr:UDP-3-O-(3-hydroxymyristoyl)glucosamine N-acyltransferase [Candidatus Neomarinimicrobiota bacterium]